jgi:hypothetical protein
MMRLGSASDKRCDGAVGVAVVAGDDDDEEVLGEEGTGLDNGPGTMKGAIVDATGTVERADDEVEGE